MGGVDGLNGATSVTVSPDGNHVYAAGYYDDAVAVFSRNSSPGVPSGMSAIPSDVSALVSWTAPTSDGGSPITGYTVTSDPGGLTATTSGTSATVTGLSEGTAYTFTVTATNAIGTSESSEASPSVTTKLTNPWDVPSMSGWGLAALVTGMFVVMVLALGLTSGSRRAARP